MCRDWFIKKTQKPFVYGNNCFLHFAISDYPGTGSDLPGCDPDQDLLFNHTTQKIGGVSLRGLKDADVTPGRFEEEIRAAYKAMPKGLLTVGYSGHGTYFPGDEADGFREALYLRGGKFTDQQLVALANDKPEELDLVFILDSCFSKGMARDYVTGNPTYKKPRFHVEFPLPPGFHVMRDLKNVPLNFLLISACAENQTASDAMFNGKPNGAFSFYLAKAIQKGLTYRQWMEGVWQNLPSDKFEQIPGIDGPERMFDRRIFEPFNV